MAASSNLRLWARYPFLGDARTHVREAAFTLADLLWDPVFERARGRAVQRVRTSLEKKGIPESPVPTDTEAEMELLSYPLARAIVATVGDSYLVNRYAVAEAKLLNENLTRDDDATVWRVAGETGIPLQETSEPDAFARLPFLEYLRHAPTRDPAWKLVNQPLQRGFISLRREHAVRLAEEAFKERLVEEFQDLQAPGRAVRDAMPRDVNEITTLVGAHRARFAPESSGEIRLEAFPPCMKAIWGGIQKSVNVPHMGRFAIVSFLHALGMDSEAILKFFATVPDFNVDKSRYQIEHITGKIGGGTQYTPPSCSAMQTYGICPLEERDEICLKLIHHPLSYYRKKLRYLPPPAKKPEPAAEVKDAAAPAG